MVESACRDSHGGHRIKLKVIAKRANASIVSNEL